ncbi:DUF1127 domain-containing protein [Roseibium marinum]|uniref:Uncharacterized protein DUF1127 n=1 Tax=Roseibium marinum TaxID=281252 RepID=A0A2S3V2P8_9HYPH|nr:DUF1127 domain-containing protein [Roseibium marinum]POF34254.1 uncharacterized protein DUF1127 [Roseibium marinum]
MSVEIDTVFHRRARSRSLLVSGLLVSALGVLASELRRYFRRRATARALSHLTADDLKDIGLVRTEFGYRELHHDRLGADYWHK